MEVLFLKKRKTKKKFDLRSMRGRWSASGVQLAQSRVSKSPLDLKSVECAQVLVGSQEIYPGASSRDGSLSLSFPPLSLSLSPSHSHLHLESSASLSCAIITIFCHFYLSQIDLVSWPSWWQVQKIYILTVQVLNFLFLSFVFFFSFQFLNRMWSIILKAYTSNFFDLAS